MLEYWLIRVEEDQLRQAVTPDVRLTIDNQRQKVSVMPGNRTSLTRLQGQTTTRPMVRLFKSRRTTSKSTISHRMPSSSGLSSSSPKAKYPLRRQPSWNETSDCGEWKLSSRNLDLSRSFTMVLFSDKSADRMLKTNRRWYCLEQ